MLSPIEAWALRRILARMPVDIDTLQLSDKMYFLCQDLSRLPIKDRPHVVEQKLPPGDIESILKIDPNAPAPSPLEVEANGQRWALMHISELIKLPRARYLLEPFIVERGLTVLYGASGTYKSFAALDYALQISQHSPTVYVVYEGVLGYYQRAAAWCAHHNRDIEKTNLYILTGMLAVMDTQELHKFIEEVKGMQPALVVLDTVARAMTGSDENSTRDMGLFVAACEELQSTLKCAVMVVHHTSKQGIQERGSGALRGAADIMIKQTTDDDTIIVECDKSKDAEPFPTMYKQPLPIEIQIDGETLSVPVLIDSALMIPDKDKLTKNQLKVLEALGMDIFKEGATSGELADSIPEIPRPSLVRVLNRLMKLGLVSQSSKREPYVLTPDGLTRLTRLSPLFTEENNIAIVSEQPLQPSQSLQAELVEGVTQ